MRARSAQKLDEDVSWRSVAADKSRTVPLLTLVLITVGAFFFCLALIAAGARHSQAGVYLPLSVLATAGKVLPPKPYEYESFMTWLRSMDFSNEKMGWVPEVAEFDLDAAATGAKYGPYMQGDEVARVLEVTKSINKWIFMDDIIQTGNIDTTGAPGTHLYILHQLLGAAANSRNPTFLDAGCGTGYLLLAWALATGNTSHAVGVDIDASVVDSAREHLADGTNLDATTLMPSNAKLDVLVGDALTPDPSSWGLVPGTVDAINVGLAVHELSELATLANLLRPGGLMTAPICGGDSEQTPDVPKNKCAGFFETFTRTADGSLQRLPGDPTIPTTFVVALRPKLSLRGKKTSLSATR